MPLAKLALKRGTWFATTLFTETDICHDWGVDMDRWAGLSEEARHRMWAYTRTKAMMESHEVYERERKSEL